MAKKKETTPFVSREDGAKARQEQRGGQLPGVVEIKNQEVTPVTTAKSTAELYVQKAKELVVDLETYYSTATEMLVTIKNAAELAELEKNKVLIPAEQVVKAEKARWKPIEKLFEEVNEILRPKMKKYLDDKEAKATAELAKLQSQIASGHISKPSTIALKEDAIYSSVPAKTVYTGSGASSSRKIPKLKITNESLIPDEYWVIDEVKLRKDVVTNDKIVPGAEKVFENSIAII